MVVILRHFSFFLSNFFCFSFFSSFFYHLLSFRSHRCFSCLLSARLPLLWGGGRKKRERERELIALVASLCRRIDGEIFSSRKVYELSLPCISCADLRLILITAAYFCEHYNNFIHGRSSLTRVIRGPDIFRGKSISRHLAIIQWSLNRRDHYVGVIVRNSQTGSLTI